MFSSLADGGRAISDAAMSTYRSWYLVNFLKRYPLIDHGHGGHGHPPAADRTRREKCVGETTIKRGEGMVTKGCFCDCEGSRRTRLSLEKAKRMHGK